jgi:hypothetical protein
MALRPMESCQQELGEIHTCFQKLLCSRYHFRKLMYCGPKLFLQVTDTAVVLAGYGLGRWTANKRAGFAVSCQPWTQVKTFRDIPMRCCTIVEVTDLRVE